MVSRQKIIVSNCPKSGYEGLLDLFQNGFRLEVKATLKCLNIPESLSGASGGAGLSRTLTLALARAVPSSLLTSSVYLPASDLSEN